jgi:hypothetical protein
MDIFFSFFLLLLNLDVVLDYILLYSCVLIVLYCLLWLYVEYL